MPAIEISADIYDRLVHEAMDEPGVTSDDMPALDAAIAAKAEAILREGLRVDHPTEEPAF